VDHVNRLYMAISSCKLAIIVCAKAFELRALIFEEARPKFSSVNSNALSHTIIASLHELIAIYNKGSEGWGLQAISDKA